ncbi:hypothetical protein Pan44_40500 [Caulifigura coniformis]|uniref:LssY-like C-terminal domain-containing protein n=1 Tax=Caulifigura coniformis TaxID=2527983 RepID=A0A517SIP1_9PLAN|nr:LssY C-terminal domain-containing protein [Caulifigura coniformis]QDT56001.1 hypothetical protein Pan44_40500 [Caulifigura coniformis]
MLTALGCTLALWGMLAYLLLPEWWSFHFHRHPSLDDTPGITQTGSGIPGDPINVALIGARDDVDRSMRAAGWRAADPLGLESDARIAADTVLDRPYQTAPVSSLYLYGRKEDLAFEMPVGGNPQHRHHVRFWRSPVDDPDGRPMWVGSASYDKGIGFSHTTGQVTHHIAEDIDTERDHVIESLKAAQTLSETYIEAGFHKTLSGKNGGGDPWKTDGDLWAGVLNADGE